MIRITVDTRAAKGMLRNISKEQIPAAIVKAVNGTAYAVRMAEKAEMQRVFDRPTTFTLNTSLHLKRTTNANQPAEVYFSKQYLEAQVFGGTRQEKVFERRLASAGILPPGWYVVPGQGARLDAAGNMPRSLIGRVLGAVNALGAGYGRKTTQNHARSKKKPSQTRLFAVTKASRAQGGAHGGLPLGIWEKVGNTRVRAIMIFVPRATYRKRFDFYGVAQRTVDKEFPREFQRAVDRIQERA